MITIKATAHIAGGRRRNLLAVTIPDEPKADGTRIVKMTDQTFSPPLSVVTMIYAPSDVPETEVALRAMQRCREAYAPQQMPFGKALAGGGE